jgi:hypothetical protein
MLSERCELVSGDFFKGLPSDADLQILHILDDDRASRLLQICHRALSTDGKLLVIEMVIPPDNRPRPLGQPPERQVDPAFADGEPEDVPADLDQSLVADVVLLAAAYAGARPGSP